MLHPTHQPHKPYRRPKTKAEKIVPTSCHQEHTSTFNPMKVVCDHMIGEHHSAYHRMIAGAVVMITGVIIAKSGQGMYHYLTDLVGYAVHGIGLIPFGDKVIEMVKNR